MITISTDNKLLDIDYIHQFLIASYWGSNRSIDDVKKSIDNSMCFGAYLNEKQIGFARIVTDKTFFSYLMDFFIDEKYQGKKYGQFFIDTIYKHSDLKKVKKHYLHTKDAQTFYEKTGFIIYPTPNKHMVKF